MNCIVLLIISIVYVYSEKCEGGCHDSACSDCCEAVEVTQPGECKDDWMYQITECITAQGCQKELTTTAVIVFIFGGIFVIGIMAGVYFYCCKADEPQISMTIPPGGGHPLISLSTPGSQMPPPMMPGMPPPMMPGMPPPMMPGMPPPMMPGMQPPMMPGMQPPMMPGMQPPMMQESQGGFQDDDCFSIEPSEDNDDNPEIPELRKRIDEDRLKAKRNEVLNQRRSAAAAASRSRSKSPRSLRSSAGSGPSSVRSGSIGSARSGSRSPPRSKPRSKSPRAARRASGGNRPSSPYAV